MGFLLQSGSDRRYLWCRDLFCRLRKHHRLLAVDEQATGRPPNAVFRKPVSGNVSDWPHLFSGALVWPLRRG